MLRPFDHILFQGDSITNAHRMPDEINLSFQLGAGYAFLVASRLLTDQPQKGLQFSNRGISGQGTTGLLARWDEDTLALQPNVLSILIGTNDAHGAIDTVKFIANYRSLLESTRATLPSVRFVICEPFALAVQTVTQDRLKLLADYSLELTILAREYSAAYVLLQDKFHQACSLAPAEHWMYDGIHPTPAGAALVADAWLETVAKQNA